MILNDHSILTSASCIYPYKDNIEKIGFGFNNRFNDLITIFDDRRRPIEKIFMHPQFDSTSLENDIAIIKAEKKIQFQDGIRALIRAKPICLLKSMEWFDKMDVFYWGKLDPKKQISSKDVKYFRYLKKTKLEDISYGIKDCNSKRRFCMRSINKKEPDHFNKTICNENGTPLLFKEDGRITSVGIFSYYSDEEKISECLSVGVYTKINAFINFIEEHAEGNVCYF